jgi:hypothetical protein
LQLLGFAQRHGAFGAPSPIVSNARFVCVGYTAKGQSAATVETKADRSNLIPSGSVRAFGEV